MEIWWLLIQARQSLQSYSHVVSECLIMPQMVLPEAILVGLVSASAAW